MADGAYRARREPRHDTVQLRGLEIHLRRWGPAPAPRSPPLYCLHGWMDSGDTFQFLVDEMSTERPVVAIDWRGFGRSARPAGDYAFSDYVADLDALLQLFSPAAPALLLGHSMGGNVACLYAGARPERVRGVVSLEGFGLAPTAPAQAPQRMRQWLDEIRSEPAFNTYDSFDQLTAAIARRHPRIGAARARFLASVWACAGDDGRVHLHGDPRHRRVFPTLYRRDESEAFWRAIDAPLLALAGRESTYLRPPGAPGLLEDFLGCVPRSTLHWIEDAGHLLHLERPEAVAAVVESFVDSL